MGLVLGRPFGDATSGLYAVNAKALPLLAEPFTTEAPEVEALIRIVDAGLRLEEVPVNMAARAGGESKLRGGKAVKVVLTVVGTLVAAKLLAGAEVALTKTRGAARRRPASRSSPPRSLFLLPTIADYRDVWDVVKQLSWEWLAVFAAVVVLNLATFAPPWLVVLPKLRFFQAIELTQASTALSLVVPGRDGGRDGRLLRDAPELGASRRREITRAMTLTGLWNQFLNLSFPIVAVFLLTARGEETALLATAAFVGVAILGVVVTGFVLALASSRLANEVGEHRRAARELGARQAAPRPGLLGRAELRALPRRRRRAASPPLARAHRASLAGSLSVFLVLLVCLRALDVPASEVSAVEAFAAWSLVRLLGTIPITPGGIGIVELGLTTALIGFGGNNAGVVAAVLVYRFLTMVPTIVLRAHRRGDVASAPASAATPQGARAPTPCFGDDARSGSSHTAAR